MKMESPAPGFKTALLAVFATCSALVALGNVPSAEIQPHALPAIQVNSDGHYLQTADGKPFFWMGDTAWFLIHATTREESSYYMKTRASQGFTVFQTVVLSEGNGILGKSALGEVPFVDGDPLKPNKVYFDRVVEIVDEAASRGLYVALLPCWADKMTAPWGDGPRIFRLDNLPASRSYAKYLGERLKGRSNVVWMLGGDRPAKLDPSKPNEWPQNEAAKAGFPAGYDWRPIWREFAAGIEEGTGGKAVFLYHPQGGNVTTSVMLAGESWLSINAMQSGHGGGHDSPIWDLIARDYGMSPAKPTLDLEPNYEDHPYNPWPRWDPSTGWFRDHDVRKQCYRSVFAGGCGVSYGHHAVWGFVGERNHVINFADRDWISALHRPGAAQMHFLRELMESRPFFSRIPDQTMIVGGAGKGGLHLQATRDREGTYAMVYFPLNDMSAVIDLRKLRSPTVRAWWFDPRTGYSHPLGDYKNEAPVEFTSPSYGPDWVLLLEDPACNYPRP